MTRYLIFLGLVLFSANTRGQQLDSLLYRIQGMRQNDYQFFNTYGIEITVVRQAGAFSPRSVSKAFRRMDLKPERLTVSDSAIDHPNFVVSRETSTQDGGRRFSHEYYIGGTGDVTGFFFLSLMRPPSPNFERGFIKMFLGKHLPDSIYQPKDPTRVIFAGREIHVEGCRWMSPNNLQCPGNGQMNWSSFQTLSDASTALADHVKYTIMPQPAKIVSDDSVQVVFEGQDVMARKIVLDFKGVTSALVGMSGGKTLTVYLVLAHVRNRYVECVMSFWNNDYVVENGLPALLSEVMELKK